METALRLPQISIWTVMRFRTFARWIRRTLSGARFIVLGSIDRSRKARSGMIMLMYRFLCSRCRLYLSMLLGRLLHRDSKPRCPDVFDSRVGFPGGSLVVSPATGHYHKAFFN